ncbi:YchJ family metal-binding protein [Variovorax sp. J22R133]|uniref:YchJ family protein n=1 Tax=Variovorax brevis TaxID=3053503 RepID=UPI0025768DFA|nr:YchJ family metal-binding protein [Variovorax sp. J22R133]MDM0114837.1 YchJ family metal-binding protein [Variovorax sp. J22R133]
MTADACPCGRGLRPGKPLTYAQCCGRFIDDFANTPAPDAESLMRSRYTAFVRERGDYLLATWHASTRPATIDFEPDMRWLGLAVRSHMQVDDGHAEVEFVARMRDASGRATRLEERSRFLREADGDLWRWYYLDAVVHVDDEA